MQLMIPPFKSRTLHISGRNPRRGVLPYLVNSYEEVADEVSHYIRGSFKSFILHIPPTREELTHTQAVFDCALRSVTS
jgi:hypothetical protein